MAETSGVGDALQRVHEWTHPLLLAQRLRRNMTSAPGDERSAAAPLGRLGHQRRLSDPSYRVGVAPNVDTLYSVAWVDLDRTAYRLDLPVVAGRYYTLQVGFADSTSVALGLRTHGERLPPVVVRRRGTTPPAAPPDAVHVESPTRYAMFALRVLVNDEDPQDLATVWSIQDRAALLRLDGSGWAPPDDGPARSGTPSGTPSGTDGIVDPGAGGASTWLAEVQAVLEDIDADQVPASVRSDLELLLHARDGTAGQAPPRSWWEEALSSAERRVEDSVSRVGTRVNGWTVNTRGCDFGDDWELRAAVARSQIYVNPAAEAIYPVAERDHLGEPLSGEHGYEVTFPRGELPPVRYFWSLTMYHAAGLLVENPARRYSVGDRTSGVAPGEDGSLTVHIATEMPASAATGRAGAVWLPAPAGGFRLMLRLYGPDPRALDGTWAPPPVRRVGHAG